MNDSIILKVNKEGEKCGINILRREQLVCFVAGIFTED